MSEPGEATDLEVEDRWYSFGEWLAGQRIRLGLTKRQAAERAELSPSTWSTIEQGGRRYRGKWVFPSPEDTTLVRISRAVQIDPWEVFEMLGRPWRDDLDPRPSRYRPNRDDPLLSPSVIDSVASDSIRVSAHGVDLAELEELDPEMYTQVMETARLAIERAKERRR